jgi:hypothetical protein
MKELIAFILPIAVALAGMRIGRWILGEKFQTEFGVGFRLAFGLAVGMVVFSQAILICAIAGLAVSALLAWVALIWGAVEVVLLAMKLPQSFKTMRFQPGHLWLILLLPMFYYWWVFGQLSTLEGTLEFDANAFWVFRAKILYLEQGQNFINTIRTPNLAYAHMDYPWLNAGIYALDYGAVGGVDEFVNKVWPFWMMVALSIGILSFAKMWSRPHPLAIGVVTIISFLPATLQFIRWEGGTIPIVFYVCMVALLMFNAITRKNGFSLAAALLLMAGCAVTKFEGVIYSVLWCCLAFPFIWKHKWFLDKTVWKSAAAAFICMLPFVVYRLLKPDPYELDTWWKAYATASPLVVPYFIKTLALYFPSRFFNSAFFHWQLVDTNHLHWDGQWIGLSSLINEQMAVLPWLLLIVLGFSLWKKRQAMPLLVLSLVMFGMMAFFTFVLTGEAYTESDVPNALQYSRLFVEWNSSDDIGRYCYPFFVAWFLCAAALWFPDESASPQPAAQPERKVAAPLAPKPKKRR